jgi:phage terminase small subunit
MTAALTPRQARFVEEYLVDLNATRAANRAGYSAKTCEQQGPRLLGNVGVASAIAGAQARRSTRTEITQDRVLVELAKLGFANMADYMRGMTGSDPYLDFSALTRDQAAALQEVTVEDYVDGRGEDVRDVKRVRFKLADKRAALVDIGRHLGMFKERVELSGGINLGLERRDRVVADVAGVFGFAERPADDAQGSGPRARHGR